MKWNIAAIRGILIYILTIVLGVSETWAQDPQFSQYYANPIYTNPAFAGSSTVGRINLNYRSQWPSISGTFRTFSASYDEHFDVINGGFGVIATADEAGVGTLRTTSVSLLYAYQINISRYITMRAGIQAGLAQKTIDFSKLTFLDQIVKGQGIVRPTGEPPITNTVPIPNISAGGIIYSNRFYAGFAIHNLNTPKQGFFETEASRIPMRYTGHGGLVIPHREHRDPKKASNFYPNILYMQQGATSQLNLGMYYNMGPIVFGGYFRQAYQTSDAVIFLLGIRTPKVKLGFSYDATLSNVWYGAKQSYEFSLGIELRKRTPKKTARSIRCPEF
jgi:type IX secretion system PorP/SprF family membrane protein